MRVVVTELPESCRSCVFKHRDVFDECYLMPHTCLPDDVIGMTYSEDGDPLYPGRYEDCPLVTFADMMKETFPPVTLPFKTSADDKRIDFSKLSYSELCHFLENHPGKRG
jgi:hypothetical protein